ncbi:hypothetical protein [uncultured Clostridium sp.]|uniref:hypothetical protein n=1 Tax=uncultured Clostridium sp. TaxID=59620 RepID=UPI0025D12497|nr:hypothetical protein [uncultured Clostridium sp.]
MIGILFILSGLICILLPKTQWHKDYIEQHNHTDLEEIINFIRKIIGYLFIILGIILLLMK